MKQQLTYIIVTFIGVSLIGGPAHAAPAGVALEIAALDDAPRLSHVPILIQVTITNTTNGDVVVPEPTFSTRDNPYNTIDLLFGSTADSLERVEYLIPNLAPWKEGLAPEAPGERALDAGESIVLEVAVSYSWRPDREALLVDSGTWYLQARYCALRTTTDGAVDMDRENGLLSNRIQVEVQAPEGAEAAALKTLRTSERPWLLAHPAAVMHVSQNSDFRRFQEIANMGAGEYSRHAAAVVAYMYAEGNALDLNPGRPPQPKVARQWLDRAIAGKSEATIHPEWRALAERLAGSEAQP